MLERLRDIEWVKSVVGMGVGVGASLGFSWAFAMNGRYDFAGGMLFVAALGGYAANAQLESVCPDKEASRTSTLTRYLPPELTGQKLVMRADTLRGLLSSYRIYRG